MKRILPSNVRAFLFCFLAFTFCFPASGHANCANPTVGAGTIIYNADYHTPQFCDGTNWIASGSADFTPTDTPLGRWKFDDGSGTSAADASGNGYTGTLNNSPTWTTGKNSGALSFNGSNTSVDLTNTPFNFERTDVFSVFAWVKTTDASDRLIVGNEESGANSKGWALILEPGFVEVQLNNHWLAPTLFITRGSAVGVADGQWHYVGFTYDGSSTELGVNMYVDGVLSNASLGGSTLTGTMASSATLRVGAFPGGGSPFNGLIDDVRIYNRVLSATEVRGLYAAAGGGSCLNPAGSEGNIVYNADAHVLQYCNGAAWHGMDAYSNKPMSGILGWWTLNDGSGTNAADSSGHGYAGTLTNSPAWTTGISGSALNFNGYTNDAWVATPSSLPFNFEYTDHFSAFAWIKTSVGTDRAIMSDGDPSLGDRGWNLYLEPGVVEVILAHSWCGNCVSRNSAANPIDGTWHHVGFTYDGSGSSSGINIYIDGALSNGTTGGSGLSATMKSTQPFQVGAYPGGGSAFDGSIDDVRVYNRELSSADVLQLYQTSGGLVPLVPVAWWKLDESSGFSAADSSGHGNTGALANMAGTEWTAGHIGNALFFDGADDNVNAGNPSTLQITGSLTMTAWVNATTLAGKDRFIMGKFSPGSNNVAYAMMISNGDCGSLKVEMILSSTGASGGAGTAARCTTTVLTTGTWYFVAGVYDASAQTMHLYVNGVADEGGLGGTVPASLYNAATNFYMGRKGNSNGEFNGLLDDVRVYNTALTAQDIANIYNGVTVTARCVGPDATEGTIMYNSDSTAMQYCNGSAWISLKGN